MWDTIISVYCCFKLLNWRGAVIHYTAISLSDTGPSAAGGSETPWGTWIRDIWGVGYKCKFLIFTRSPEYSVERDGGRGKVRIFSKAPWVTVLCLWGWEGLSWSNSPDRPGEALRADGFILITHLSWGRPGRRLSTRLLIQSSFYFFPPLYTSGCLLGRRGLSFLFLFFIFKVCM